MSKLGNIIKRIVLSPSPSAKHHKDNLKQILKLQEWLSIQMLRDDKVTAV